MNYYNLKHKEEVLDFKDASILGQGKEKGLFFPTEIPAFSEEFIKNIKEKSNQEIALACVKDFVGNAIPQEKLLEIISETINFEIPLKKVTENIYSLELFHGPTLAFKDVGARFMSRCLGYFLQNESKKVTVLVATSGDTGGAVANGFLGIEGIEVVILYPKNRVSPVQEKQLTALGKNIIALEVDGSFDDCQKLVKEAFSDEDLQKNLKLTSANSINVARWLPQQIYYALALKQWPENSAPVISVPSGNFGNICAGLLTKVRGLPTDVFIAACNQNDIVSHYLETQQLITKETKPTLSNAMDVGNPSNFVRVIEIFNQKFAEIQKNLVSFTISDEETLETIARVFRDDDYTLDPHGAVAFLALEKYLEKNSSKKGIFIETAHPVKFPEAVEKATSQNIEIPESLSELMNAEKKAISISPDYNELKNILQQI